MADVDRVYNIIDYIEVPAPLHSGGTVYKVCYGTVNWGDGKLREAVFTLMVYGNGTVGWQRSPHMLVKPDNTHSLSELDQVLAAIATLKARHNL